MGFGNKTCPPQPMVPRFLLVTGVIVRTFSVLILVAAKCQKKIWFCINMLFSVLRVIITGIITSSDDFFALIKTKTKHSTCTDWFPFVVTFVLNFNGIFFKGRVYKV